MPASPACELLCPKSNYAYCRDCGYPAVYVNRSERTPRYRTTKFVLRKTIHDSQNVGELRLPTTLLFMSCHSQEKYPAVVTENKGVPFHITSLTEKKNMHQVIDYATAVRRQPLCHSARGIPGHSMRRQTGTFLNHRITRQAQPTTMKLPMGYVAFSSLLKLNGVHSYRISVGKYWLHSELCHCNRYLLDHFSLTFSL